MIMDAPLRMILLQIVRSGIFCDDGGLEQNPADGKIV